MKIQELMDILQAMDPEKEAFVALMALSQICIFEAKSENPVFENQWLVTDIEQVRIGEKF